MELGAPKFRMEQRPRNEEAQAAWENSSGLRAEVEEYGPQAQSGWAGPQPQGSTLEKGAQLGLIPKSHLESAHSGWALPW